MKSFLIKYKDSNKDAVVKVDSAITYRALYERSSAIAQNLKSLLEHRSHIAIILSNSISYVTAYCSILLSEKL